MLQVEQHNNELVIYIVLRNILHTHSILRGNHLVNTIFDKKCDKFVKSIKKYKFTVLTLWLRLF